MSLSKLLDTVSFRRLQLIEILVFDDIWWTIEKLSTLLDCSSRTLIADIQTINSKSKDNFFIRTSKQRGVKLIISDLFHVEDVYQEFVENSLNFQIIKSIIELDVTTSEELSELLYTSQSSIRRNLKQLNVFLAEYKLSIQSKPIKITGSEKQIRYFYSVFLCEYYYTNVENFQHQMKEWAFNFLETLEKKESIPSQSCFTNYKTLIWIIVCLDRVSKGYFIEENYLTIKMVTIQEKQLLYKFKEQLSFELSGKEIDFMMYVYWNNRYEFEKIDLVNNAASSYLYQQVLFFINQLKKETGYSIQEESFLITNLMGYYFNGKFFSGPGNFLFNTRRRNTELSEKTFSDFTNKVENVVNRYPRGSWIYNMQIKELVFVLMLFWKGLITQIISKKEKINIMICSYIGAQQERLLGEMIESRFPTVVDCSAFSSTNLLKDTIQLVLTDHKINETQQTMVQSKKVIGIDIVPTKRDWKRIERAIKDIQLEQERLGNRIV
ncbi:MAG: helix-turn-helix domain-containing protein [Carnobacterium sp.]|nr:helix-turn-helix domain-containing protein [Carnobacterium sp.]